jgi:hypothetical protein
VTISRPSPLRMRNVLDKSCRKLIHIFYVQLRFFLKSCRLWDYVEKYDGARGTTSDVTVWRVRVACWISKVTCTRAHAPAHISGHTHARVHALACIQKYVIFIAFPQQQWLRECTSVLRDAYIACLVCIYVYTYVAHLHKSEFTLAFPPQQWLCQSTRSVSYLV